VPGGGAAPGFTASPVDGRNQEKRGTVVAMHLTPFHTEPVGDANFT
jgi:hypothetical protein